MWYTKDQEYMGVMKMASVKSRRKAMESSSRLPVRRERERLEGIVALGRDQICVGIGVARRSSEDGRFGWFGPQNHHTVRFAGLGLKIEAQCVLVSLPLDSRCTMCACIISLCIW